jgi:streptomycin 6-kinase
VLVPDDLRRSVPLWAGAAGVAWLDSLPSLVSALAEEWRLDVGAPYVPSGLTALALRVTCADGTPAVLKVRFPEEDGSGEAAALRHFGGVAAVTLLASDDARAALLLERCEPGTPLLDRPDDEAAYTVCGLLGELWSPPSPGHSFRTTRESANRWAATVSGSTTVDARLRDEVVASLRELAADDVAPVVLHGDLHPANVLRATRRPWLTIDPKGKAGDPAYDVAALLRDRATPATAPRRLAIAAEVLGLDRARMRAWALAQAVEGAVWSSECGDVAAGESFREEASALAAL